MNALSVAGWVFYGMSMGLACMIPGQLIWGLLPFTVIATTVYLSSIVLSISSGVQAMRIESTDELRSRVSFYPIVASQRGGMVLGIGGIF